jgi:hypothetical protein
LVRVTVAPEITASVASVTTPVIDDESWALMAEGAMNIPATRAKTITAYSLAKWKQRIKNFLQFIHVRRLREVEGANLFSKDFSSQLAVLWGNPERA